MFTGLVLDCLALRDFISAPVLAASSLGDGLEAAVFAVAILTLLSPRLSGREGEERLISGRVFMASSLAEGLEGAFLGVCPRLGVLVRV